MKKIRIAFVVIFSFLIALSFSRQAAFSQGRPEELVKKGEAAEKKKDYHTAVKYYFQAAKMGNAQAQLDLGSCYVGGDGVPKDLKKATEWFRKSAEQGNPTAQFEMGWNYEHGSGIEKNLGQAKHWYSLAAKNGDKTSKDRLESLGPVADQTSGKNPSDQGNSNAGEGSNNLVFRERFNAACNPHYPQGLTGTLHVWVEVQFLYNPEHDPEVLAREEVPDIQQKISDLAAANPNGPQFVFENGRPADLMLIFRINGRHPDSKGTYTAYWAQVELDNVKGIGSSGWANLFSFSTEAFDRDDHDPAGKGWFAHSVDEGIQKWYDYVSNGWKCN